MSSNIRIPKHCQFCGKPYIARTTKTKFCGDTCSKRAYKARKKQESILDSKNNVTIVKATENPISNKEFLTRQEASVLLGISLSTLKRLLAKRMIPYIKAGGRIVISKQELIKALSR